MFDPWSTASGPLAQIETPLRRRFTFAETNASGNAFDLQCDLPRLLINDDLEVSGEILVTIDRDPSISKSNRSKCIFDKGFASFGISHAKNLHPGKMHID